MNKLNERVKNNNYSKETKNRRQCSCRNKIISNKCFVKTRPKDPGCFFEKIGDLKKHFLYY